MLVSSRTKIGQFQPMRETLVPAARHGVVRRILFIDHTAKMGGGEIALLNLIRCIDRTRFLPVVLLFSDGPLRDRLLADGVETHLIVLGNEVASARKDSLGGVSFLRIKAAMQSASHVWRVRRFIASHQIDLVHTNSLKADVLGGLAARFARRPLVWHVRDRIADDYLPSKVVKIFRLLCRLIPGYVIANSAATMATLCPSAPSTAAEFDAKGQQSQSSLSAAAPKLRVIHDGTPLSTEMNGGISQAPLRLIGLVGRISPWKGQHIFVQAAALVHEKFPDARFQIIGAALFDEDDFDKHLRQLVHSQGLDDIVEFTGFRQDVDAIFRQLDIVVHASTTGEPFGQVVIEGMSASKPIVATNGGGIPEIVVDGATGLLVPMNDVPAMANAICQLLADPVEARNMGRRARQRVVEHFTIQMTARKIESLYDDILDSTSSD